MKLKNLFMIGAAAMALAACSNSKTCDKNCDKADASDDVKVTYAGEIPGADGTYKYDLVMEYDDNGTKGDYVMTQTVVGQDVAPIVTKGDFKVYTPTNDSKDQKYIQLTPDHNDRASEAKAASDEVYYFLIDSDSTLTMVGADLQPAASGLNYTLTVVK